MFVDLSAKLQTRVVDAFAAHDSVLEAAHEKCKDKHPELHAKYQKAKKLIEFADRHLAMLQTKTKRTTGKQSLLSRRGGQRFGFVKKHVVKAVVKHIIAPVAKAVERHIIAPVAKAAAKAYKSAGKAVKGIGDHLDDIAEVRKGGREGRGADEKDASREKRGTRREKQRKCDPGSTSHARVPQTLPWTNHTVLYKLTYPSLPTPTPLHPSPRSAPYCTRQAAKDIANDMGEGLISVGGVLVKGIDEVGKAYVRKAHTV